MDHAPNLKAPAAFRPLSRFAAFLARPTSHVHPSHFDALGGKRLTQLTACRELAAPIDRAVFEALSLDRLDLSDDLLARLGESSETTVALMVTAAEPEDLHLAARMLSAAIQHRFLAALVTRTDRENAIAQLGQKAFQFAIREASAFYGGLASLASDRGPELSPSLNECGEDCAPMVALGFAWLFAFVQTTEPALGAFFALRLPKGFEPPTDQERLDLRCKAQIGNLLRRKIPGWNACTA